MVSTRRYGYGHTNQTFKCDHVSADVHLSMIVSSQPLFVLHSPPSLPSKCMPQQTMQALMSRALFNNSSSSSLMRCLMQTCYCLWGDFNAELGCEAQLWGGAIGRFGLSAPTTDNGTRLLHLCMANNLVVTDTIFQHKPVHLPTWYNANATDSTKHQIDHVLFRRRDIKAVQDTRIFRGADIESDHRLMVCKLRLKSQPNIDSILAYSLLPFTVKQARKHSSYPCRACWLHTTTSLLGMWSTAGEPSKAPSTLRHRLS